MTDFTRTNWAKTEFSRNYLDKADLYVVDRRRMFGLLRSFMGHFLPANSQKRLLDLGCGDGILTEQLMEADGRLSATLLDGSADMLGKARKRLERFPEVRYIHAGFQDLLDKDILETTYDFVISSMAIHHLTPDEKKMLFSRVYSSLSEGGYFVNIDVVLPPAGPLDDWYMKLWQDWMDGQKVALGIKEGEEGPSVDIVQVYKNIEENKPDTLEFQLDALVGTGFIWVDCFYKHGIFAVYGGKK